MGIRIAYVMKTRTHAKRLRLPEYVPHIYNVLNEQRQYITMQCACEFITPAEHAGFVRIGGMRAPQTVPPPVQHRTIQHKTMVCLGTAYFDALAVQQTTRAACALHPTHDTTGVFSRATTQMFTKNMPLGVRFTFDVTLCRSHAIENVCVRFEFGSVGRTSRRYSYR